MSTEKKITGEEQVYPVAASYSDDAPNVLVPTPGMTLRQYYAGLAMAAMISTGNGFDAEPGWMEHVAKCAVKQADALITALNNNPVKE